MEMQDMPKKAAATREDRYSRTVGLLGESAVEKLRHARVLIFGLGGVGGFAAEALLRSGVENMTLVDGDTVAESNLNRQLFATTDVIGLPKTQAALRRLLSVNPGAKIDCLPLFFGPETPAETVDFARYDYVIDAIDSVAAKVEIVRRAKAAGVPVISAMGAGNKVDPTAFVTSDISKTDTCPLARAVRLALRRQGITHLTVVWSRELPRRANARTAGIPASFAPAVGACGLTLAARVILDLTADTSENVFEERTLCDNSPAGGN